MEKCVGNVAWGVSTFAVACHIRQPLGPCTMHDSSRAYMSESMMYGDITTMYLVKRMAINISL